MIKSAGSAALAVVAAVLMSGCASAPGPRTADDTGGHSSGSRQLCAVIAPAPRAGEPAPPPPTACPTSAPVFTPPAPAPSTPSIPPTSSKPPGHYPYAWADAEGDPITDAATYTLVHGISPLQALRIVAPHPRTRVESPAQVNDYVVDHETNDYAREPELIVAGQRHGWTMIIEDNDYRATIDATLRELSHAGAAVVIYSDVEVDTSFEYAVRGRVVRNFDPFAYVDNGPGQHHLPQERGIGFGRHGGQRYVSQSVHLAARLVGFEIVPSDLDYDHYDLAVAALPVQ